MTRSAFHHEPRVITRFWKYVEIRAPHECWLWTGAGRSGRGYGRFRVGGKDMPMVSPHRFALELTGVSIPAGMIVLHLCDNPSCVNPDHLRVGTYKENTHDAMNKGRMKFTFKPGADSRRGRGPIKLREEDVRFIRASSVPAKELSCKYGVDPSLIRQIRSRKAWKNVV